MPDLPSISNSYSYSLYITVTSYLLLSSSHLVMIPPSNLSSPTNNSMFCATHDVTFKGRLVEEKIQNL